jgi:uncharacterized protein (DUF4415 family)
MSVATTGKRSSRKKAAEPSTDWKRLRSLTAAQIRAGLRKDADSNPTEEAFWEKAKVVMLRSKKTVTMRLDADLLDWFRGNPGYQTRINAILRACMNAQVDNQEVDSQQNSSATSAAIPIRRSERV